MVSLFVEKNKIKTHINLIWLGVVCVTVKTTLKKVAFIGLLLLAKRKNCLTVEKHAFIENNKTFKCFGNSQRLLDRIQNFEILEEKEINAKLPSSWKKSLFLV